MAAVKGKRDGELERVRCLVGRLTASAIGKPITFCVERDVKRPTDGRVFIQCEYLAPCSVTGNETRWRGRKWYLSDHMTDDEVVKTSFAAFKATVDHEVMEGFLFDGQRVFNPHVDFRALMTLNGCEVYRKP